MAPGNNTTTFGGANFQYIVPPQLKRTTSEDRHKNFHKKLSNKLEALYKKKDYQLMLELTKSKIV
jgi:hypothetical protein